MPLKPQPWNTTLMTLHGRQFSDGVNVHVYTYREALARDLPVFSPLESRMLAEWADIEGRLAVVKPNVTTGLPTSVRDHRPLECENICWAIVQRLNFKNFNEAYLVDWPDEQGLKILSPVVNGLADASTISVEEQRELILRHPEAAAEFLAQKIITNDYDDRSLNYVIREDGQSLVRIDYGCAFTPSIPSGVPPLTTLMGCVTLEELAEDPRFRHRFANIAQIMQAVPKSNWQHIVDSAQNLNLQDKQEIFEQIRTAPQRLRHTMDSVMFSSPSLPRTRKKASPHLKAG